MLEIHSFSQIFWNFGKSRSQLRGSAFRRSTTKPNRYRFLNNFLPNWGTEPDFVSEAAQSPKTFRKHNQIVVL